MIASTSTGTVSLLRVCSATNWVVRSRVSISAVTLSRIGTIQNSPGPLTARNLPARRTTACSHCWAILSAASTIMARMIEDDETGEDDQQNAEDREDRDDGERDGVGAHGSHYACPGTAKGLIPGTLQVEIARAE